MRAVAFAPSRYLKEKCCHPVLGANKSSFKGPGSDAVLGAGRGLAGGAGSSRHTAAYRSSAQEPSVRFSFHLSSGTERFRCQTVTLSSTSDSDGSASPFPAVWLELVTACFAAGCSEEPFHCLNDRLGITLCLS